MGVKVTDVGYWRSDTKSAFGTVTLPFKESFLFEQDSQVCFIHARGALI